MEAIVSINSAPCSSHATLPRGGRLPGSEVALTRQADGPGNEVAVGEKNKHGGAVVRILGKH